MSRDTVAEAVEAEEEVGLGMVGAATPKNLKRRRDTSGEALPGIETASVKRVHTEVEAQVREMSVAPLAVPDRSLYKVSAGVSVVRKRSRYDEGKDGDDDDDAGEGKSGGEDEDNGEDEDDGEGEDGLAPTNSPPDLPFPHPNSTTIPLAPSQDQILLETSANQEGSHDVDDDGTNYNGGNNDDSDDSDEYGSEEEDNADQLRLTDSSPALPPTHTSSTAVARQSSGDREFTIIYCEASASAPQSMSPLAGSSGEESPRDHVLSVPVHVAGADANSKHPRATLSEPVETDAESSSESEESDTSPPASSVAMSGHEVVVSVPHHVAGAPLPTSVEFEGEQGVEDRGSRASVGRDAVRDADSDRDVDIGDVGLEGERGEGAHGHERGKHEQGHPKTGRNPPPWAESRF